MPLKNRHVNGKRLVLTLQKILKFSGNGQKLKKDARCHGLDILNLKRHLMVLMSIGGRNYELPDDFRRAKGLPRVDVDLFLLSDVQGTTGS